MAGQQPQYLKAAGEVPLRAAWLCGRGRDCVLLLLLSGSLSVFLFSLSSPSLYHLLSPFMFFFFSAFSILSCHVQVFLLSLSLIFFVIFSVSISFLSPLTTLLPLGSLFPFSFPFFPWEKQEPSCDAKMYRMKKKQMRHSPKIFTC